MRWLSLLMFALAVFAAPASAQELDAPVPYELVDDGFDFEAQLVPDHPLLPTVPLRHRTIYDHHVFGLQHHFVIELLRSVERLL